ncbi:PREDICTED: pancreatic triacylglycerol lipase-like [Eufriesea mexicana]|uniref:pancreatic triacylglycerol lipase-like n=1 Tax=Eufriesea mexicana TaxID=516756 RepID=UPI00083BC0D9|nr:PREDICTED: pancreatic triacylglycerol lipase-like [Eufriesea mexicana]
MKIFVLIVCSIICSVTAQDPFRPISSGILKIESIVDDAIETAKDLYMIDDHGNQVPLDINELLPETLWQTERKLPDRMHFYLYTKENPTDGQQLYIDDVKTLNNSNFDPQKETKIITHGWMNNYLSDSCVTIRDAYLKNSDYNVVVMDWGQIAVGPYIWVSDRILIIGKFAAKMVSFLESQGLDENKLTIVGHSLGAHIAGFASYYAKRKANYVVKLDAAQPNLHKVRFAPNQAMYTTSIHTDSFFWGQDIAIADSDFWPNSGLRQPGCGLNNACSHSRSYIYFAESINSEVGFVGVQCTNYPDYVLNKCANNPTGIMGGAKLNTTLRGNYYLKTNLKAPFARGSKSRSAISEIKLTMKSLAIIACCIIYSAVARNALNPSIENVLEIEDDIQAWDRDLSDDNDNLVKRDLSSILPEKLEQTEKDLPNRVFFYLYTRNSTNEPQKLFIDDVETLKKSHFNVNKETKIVTHGWRNDYTSASCQLIRKAFLQNSDCNVIVIDWGKIAKKEYYWASNRVLMVGKFAAKMISFLESQGMDENKLTIVGHSLGAHVAGLASNYAARKANYVVGLDPAQPNFSGKSSDARFSRGQGKFVEAIHSDAGVLGMNNALADADFWPDGGHVQSGCKVNDISCSHGRSYEYFAESINSEVGFVGVQCSNYDKYLRNECAHNPTGIMGGAKPQPGLKGNYFLKMNAKSPYAKGISQ